MEAMVAFKLEKLTESKYEPSPLPPLAAEDGSKVEDMSPPHIHEKVPRGRLRSRGRARAGAGARARHTVVMGALRRTLHLAHTRHREEH
ncbi:hypothetical protein F511_42319 [Dorcoceras hygrometricum]|uniref:Uncharacterized protein n=1 Tax=Dorcoceras hygrometricum TaxID=472368 RepID=A0A2Z6ZZ56_9LAMI|nr:hypothetical protein F511_42319 [Dorcoceras hygrometricum]